MISRIDHVVLTVRDIEASVAFYVRVFDMEPVTFAGGRRALSFGQQKINLQTLGQETRNRAATGSGDLCLISDWAVPDILDHLVDLGLPLLEGPVAKTGALGPITSMYIHDPDENLIEIAVYDSAG